MRKPKDRQLPPGVATIPMVQQAFDRGDFSQALQLAHSIVLRQPLNHLALYHLGLVQNVLGQSSEAEKSLRKAISLNGNSALYWGQLGTILQDLNQIDAAREPFERCLALKPKFAGTIAAAADHFLVVNDVARAIEIIEPLLNEPEPAPAVLLIGARIARIKRTAEYVLAKLEARSRDQRVPPPLRGSLLFHLAPLYEMAGRFDDAFDAIEEANVLRPREFSPVVHSATIDGLINAWTIERRAQIPAGTCDASQSQVPVFIVGMPRSGTTLVEQMLSSHSRCYGGGELDLIGWLIVQHSVNFGVGDPQYLLAPQLLSERVVNESATHYLTYLKKFDPAAMRITDKNPINYRHLGFINTLFPKAAIIHCIRHPLDTAVSCYFHDFAGNIHFHSRLEHIGSCYADYVRLMDHWKALMPDRILDVRYEDLVKNPEREIRRVLEFVGLHWESRVLEFHKNSRIVVTASMHQVRRPLYHTAVGRWKRYQHRLGPLIDTLRERGVEV